MGRSPQGNAPDKDQTLLADAPAADQFARTLLTDRGENIAPHDSLAPSNSRRLGLGKGTLTAVIAEVEARGTQRAAACGKDAGEVKPRPNRAKYAFGAANKFLNGPKTMVAANLRTGLPTCGK